jgi:hypothetical protein
MTDKKNWPKTPLTQDLMLDITEAIARIQSDFPEIVEKLELLIQCMKVQEQRDPVEVEQPEADLRIVVTLQERGAVRGVYGYFNSYGAAHAWADQHIQQHMTVAYEPMTVVAGEERLSKSGESLLEWAQRSMPRDPKSEKAAMISVEAVEEAAAIISTPPKNDWQYGWNAAMNHVREVLEMESPYG